jgi:hypothetical protein
MSGMMNLYAFLIGACLMLSAPAKAGDEMDMAIAGHLRPMALIPKGDRAVEIDWETVQAALHDPHADYVMRGMARLLLAARDGTWITIEREGKGGRAP